MVATAHVRRPGLAVASGLALVASLVSHESAAAHPLVGLAFVALAGAHLAGRRRWLGATARRLGSGLRRRVAVRLVAVGLLVAALAAVAGTGLAAWAGADAARGPHTAAAAVLVAAVLWHLALHRRSLTRRRKERP